MQYSIQTVRDSSGKFHHNKGDKMALSLFLTLLFMHIAFGLALAFMVMYFASRSQGWLKSLGFVVGGLLIFLAALSIILGSIFAATKPYSKNCPLYMHEKMQREKMTEQGMPMMQGQREEKEDNLDDEKTDNDSGCSLKSKEQLNKEIKEGKKTGAACRAELN